MTRGGLKTRPQGERRCIVNGESADRTALIRFVLSPDGIVTPDILERLDGRGVWVSAKPEALETAIRKKGFARGFKQEVTLPDGLMANVDLQLSNRVISLLSMARKSGQAFSGAEKTKEALQNGAARIIFQASDGSEREKRNLSFRNEADARFECLNRQELGMAFSKENVVHAALTGEGLTNRVKEEAIRLSSWRGVDVSINEEAIIIICQKTIPKTKLSEFAAAQSSKALRAGVPSKSLLRRRKSAL